MIHLVLGMQRTGVIVGSRLFEDFRLNMRLADREESSVRYVRRVSWFRPYKRVKRGVWALHLLCLNNDRFVGALKKVDSNYKRVLPSVAGFSVDQFRHRLTHDTIRKEVSA